MITFQGHTRGVDWETLRQDLISDRFHNGRTPAQLKASFENSQHVAMAFEGARCIGNARALSDGVGNAYILDVWTHSDYRRKGIGREMVDMLTAAVPAARLPSDRGRARILDGDGIPTTTTRTVAGRWNLPPRQLTTAAS